MSSKEAAKHKLVLGLPKGSLQETTQKLFIRAGYDLLHLVTYFTVGPKEARAWTITKGTKGISGRTSIRDLYFLNGAAKLETSLAPHELLGLLQQIEDEFGSHRIDGLPRLFHGRCWHHHMHHGHYREVDNVW